MLCCTVLVRPGQTYVIYTHDTMCTVCTYDSCVQLTDGHTQDECDYKKSKRYALMAAAALDPQSTQSPAKIQQRSVQMLFKRSRKPQRNKNTRQKVT